MSARPLIVIAIAACRPIVSAPASTHCEPGADQVAVFEHDHFFGACMTLAVGDHVFPEQIGLPDDSASSILVGANVRALGCQARAFGDACAYLDHATPVLGATPVGNDTLSSLRVEPRPTSCDPEPGQVALFTDPGFAGACVVLGIGDFAHSPELGVPNDTVSSIRVGPATQVLACGGDSWGEPCDPITRDVADLAGSRVGTDTISAVRVLRGGTACVARGANAAMAPHVATVEAICARDYPRILELLATEQVFSPPLVISFTRLATFTAETRYRDLFIDEVRWNPTDMAMLSHELTHVVTMYPSAPLWITEGVADFVRAELNVSNGWNYYQCRGDETYTAGYGCAAALLRFAENRAPGTVRELHARLRTQAFDGLIAGIPVDDLWRECQRGPCAPR
jgi:hypothetical protein